jgi:hypothetical protein
VKTCDRHTFMMLAAGDLLVRDETGKVLIGDVQEAHEAMAAHDRGEVVRLRVSENGYTYIQNGTERKVL